MISSQNVYEITTGDLILSGSLAGAVGTLTAGGSSMLSNSSMTRVLIYVLTHKCIEIAKRALQRWRGRFKHTPAVAEPVLLAVQIPTK